MMGQRWFFSSWAVALLLLAAGAAAQTGPVISPEVINGPVYAIARTTTTVYLGGAFTSIGGLPRHHIAALDSRTGALTAWNPDANADVTCLAVAGSTVYAGGAFTGIGGQARNRIAALDAATGNATAWNPDADGTVGALLVAGSTVYAGGQFTSLGGQPRNRIAALDIATGDATAWNPNANGFINCLALSGSTVYAGGHFSSIGGQTRSCLAALDLASGNATAWDPNSDNDVYTLAVSGGSVYAGGAFNIIGGQGRNYLAELSAATGAATAWDPAPDNPVYALAPAGSAIFAGGLFTNIGGQARSCLAALNVTTSTATAWAPNADAMASAIVATSYTLDIGGAFTHIGGQNQQYYARYRLDTTPPDAPAAPTGPGAVTTSTAVAFTWLAALDSGSGVDSYDCQIGTSAGAADVFSGNVGAALSKSFTGAYGVTYYARVRAIDAVGNVGPWSASSAGVWVVLPPAVTVPPADQSLLSGAAASLTLTAAGTAPLTYQWKRNGTLLSDGARISGAATAALGINPARAADSGLYTCTVTNAGGTTTSLGAQLLVTPPPGSPTLTVVSAFGTPDPAVGTLAYENGVTVDAVVNGSPVYDGADTTRQLCTGWTLTDGGGTEIARGSTTSASFTVDQNLTLTWLWQKQYLLTALARPAVAGRIMLDDGVTTASGWYADGANIMLHGDPRTAFAMTRWTGDAPSDYPDDIPLTMDGPKAVKGYFHPVLRLSAALGSQVTPLGQYGGASYAATLDAHYAYIAEGPRLTILDLTDPESLAVGSLLLPDIIRKIVLKNGLIYIATSGAGLQIAQLNEVGTPQWLEGVDTPGNANDVLVLGGYAYIADGYLGGVQVADVSNPLMPKIVGASARKVTALGLASQGNSLFVAGNGIQVFDLSAPAYPLWAAEAAPTDNTAAVSVAQGRAYVATSRAGLKVWNVATPTSPTLLFAYTGKTNIADVAVTGTLVAIAEQGGLHLLDASSDTTAPREIARYPLAVSSPRVAMAGGLATLSDATSSVRVLDISNTHTTPTLRVKVATHCVSPGVRGYSQGLSTLSAYLFVTDWVRGLEIIDMNYTDNPLHLGSYSSSGGNAARGVVVTGDGAYLTDHYYGLVKIGIADLTSPTLAGSYVMSAAGVGLTTTGLACVANALGGLSVLDAGTMHYLQGTTTGSGGSRGVAVKGNLAYLADWNKGLRVLTVTTSTSPVVALTFSTSGQACGVALSDDGGIFVADGDGGVRAFRLGVTTTTLISVPGFATAVAPAANGLLYIAAATGGLQVYNMTGPTPRRVAYYPVPGGAYGVVAQDDQAYVAAGDGGVFVVHVDSHDPAPAATPTPTPTPNVMYNGVRQWRMYEQME